MTLWLNGAYHEAGASVDALDRGLLLGDGVFETIYVENGRCAFLQRHLTRLRVGLDALRIAEPPALGGAAEIVASLCARDDMAGPAAARITITRGPGVRGLRADPSAGEATLLVSVSLMPSPSDAPLRLHLSGRRYSGAAANAFKATGGYIENMMAHNAALDVGADEALMLNERGSVACAAAANVFLIEEGAVATPPLSEGAMPGIVRALLLEAAGSANIPVEEKAIDAASLNRGEIFVTNSLIGLRPCVLAGGRERRDAAGDVFQRLRTWYQELLARECAEKSSGR